MITLAWILGKPLTLLFDPYESIVLFLSGEYRIDFFSRRLTNGRLLIVLTVNYVIQDGKSNWLEGLILMCTSFSGCNDIRLTLFQAYMSFLPSLSGSILVSFLGPLKV